MALPAADSCGSLQQRIYISKHLVQNLTHTSLQLWSLWVTKQNQKHKEQAGVCQTQKNDTACLGPQDKFLRVRTSAGLNVGFCRLREFSSEMLTLLSVFLFGNPVWFIILLLLPWRRGHLLQLTAQAHLKQKFPNGDTVLILLPCGTLCLRPEDH